MAETKQFDLAVAGTGHNALVCANYLARAGLRVVVFEARRIVRGACVTGSSGHNAAMRILVDLRCDRLTRQVRASTGGETIIDSILESAMGR